MRTKFDLLQHQNRPLHEKYTGALKHIQEFHAAMNGNIFVAFSGGIDSTVVLHLTRTLYPDTPAVFINTGLEYPENVKHVRNTPNVTWLKPKMHFKDILEKYGYPVVSKEMAQYIYEYRNTKSEIQRKNRINGNKWGKGKITPKWLFMLDAPFKISSKCCYVMKHAPDTAFRHKTGLFPLLGLMAEESFLRESNWYKFGCVTLEGPKPQALPIACWRHTDVLQYIHENHIPYSTIYNKGYKQTGCMFCCFGVHLESLPNRFQKMKVDYPAQWNYCINKLNIRQVLDYIKVPFE